MLPLVVVALHHATVRSLSSMQISGSYLHASGSLGHLDAHHFAWFTFHGHFKRPATNLAVGREALRLDGGIDDDLAGLPAIGALNGLTGLHGGSAIRTYCYGYYLAAASSTSRALCSFR